MAGPRQKRKLRSSRSKVKTGVDGRTKTGKKKVNFLGNEIIRKNWDNKLTLTQNYERLGLSVRLNGATGGTEKKLKRTNRNTNNDNNNKDSLRISNSGARTAKLIPEEVQVERDPETGAILRIMTGDDDVMRTNPLNDPLNDLENEDDEEEQDQDEFMDFDDEEEEEPQQENDIVKQLEAQAAAELEEITQKKKPRTQSAREEEWISNLVRKYGDDYGKMVRDRKLNPRQQSEGDIKRRVQKWMKIHG